MKRRDILFLCVALCSAPTTLVFAEDSKVGLVCQVENGKSVSTNKATNQGREGYSEVVVTEKGVQVTGGGCVLRDGDTPERITIVQNAPHVSPGINPRFDGWACLASSSGQDADPRGEIQAFAVKCKVGVPP